MGGGSRHRFANHPPASYALRAEVLPVFGSISSSNLCPGRQDIPPQTRSSSALPADETRSCPDIIQDRDVKSRLAELLSAANHAARVDTVVLLRAATRGVAPSPIGVNGG